MEHLAKRVGYFLQLIAITGLFAVNTVAANEGPVEARLAPPGTGLTPPRLPPHSFKKGQGLFATLSDIHFNPFYDPALVDTLAAAAPSTWHEIFAASPIDTPSRTGSDTNYPLFVSMLDSVSRYANTLDYLLVPGDLLSHNFKKNYDHSASNRSPAAYRQFVLKTTRFITGELKARFPDIPILVTLGNNDAFCGDYLIEPGADYLRNASPTLANLTGQQGDFTDFPALGAYTVPHPLTEKHYFVVFDNIFFSRNYANPCGSNRGNPSQSLLTWLATTLDGLERSGATATLVMHVPSGIDGHASTTTCREATSPVPYLSVDSDRAFNRLMLHYRSVVTAIFSGHSHMDDFRVFTDEQGKAYTYQRIIPSVSPLFGNNPGYQIYSYDRRHGTPVDYLTMTYPVTGKTDTSRWKREYEFGRDYPGITLNAEGLRKLAEGISANQTLRDKFIEHYTGGIEDNAQMRENWQAFACALTHLEAPSFQRCLCGSTD